jgi:hypothetical protein
MRRALLRVGVLSACALIGASMPAFADCPDGVRQATARESEHFKRVYAQLKAALPPPPPDWSMAPVPGRSYESTCQGTREGDVRVDVRATYTYRLPKAQADRHTVELRKLAAEVEALQKLPPDVARERQRWMDKYSEATRAARQADKDGNRTLAKQKYAEREEYDRQANAVRARYNDSIQPKVAPLRARMAELDINPKTVRVHVVTNDSAQLGPKDIAEITIGTIPAPGQRPAFKVAGIHVQLEGPAAQREALAAAFDKAKLQQVLR